MMRRSWVPMIALSLVLGLAVSNAGATAGSTNHTKQVSVTPRGGNPGSPSNRPSISANGRYVAFASKASNLTPGDGNDLFDIFVRDMRTGTTLRASVDTEGGDPDGDSLNPSISVDGRYVAFESAASDLVVEDSDTVTDVFVRDLVAGTTTRASYDQNGDAPNDDSLDPSVTADGRYLAFRTYATDVLADHCGGGVFVRDLIANQTVRIDVDTEGGCAEFGGPSFSPTISADGRYVVFDSYAEDLVEHDTNGEPDIFVRDLVAGQTLLASQSTEGNGTDDTSYNPAISADGRYVAFDSYAHYLVKDDHNGITDVFVHDLLTRTTIRASVDVNGADADGYSFLPSISIGGRYVAFQSDASNLVAGDGNDTIDIYVRDIVNGTTVRASVDTGGGDPDAMSTYAAISPLGGYVVFQSAAQDLVEGGDRVVDAFVVRLP